ncbi:hypothetical protein MD484_g6170, partial [Candolleomyces efflorescens]
MALHERTPLLQSNGARSPTTSGEQGDPTRLIADAVSRISSVSLDPEVIQDILTTESTLGQGYSPTDYGYALTVLLSYREQKVKQQTAPELDLYGQWTQEQAAHKDAEALDKLVGTLWGQFLLHYRTDKEVDTVLWSQFSQDATSGVVLQVADFLATPNPPISLLTHPLTEAAIQRRWKSGRHYAVNQPSTLLQRIDTLVGTPRNVHFIALISKFTYLALLAHYVIYPPGRVSTDGSLTEFIGPYEEALFIFTLSLGLFLPSPSSLPYVGVLAALVLPSPGLAQPGDGFFDVLLIVLAFQILTLHTTPYINPLFIKPFPASLPLAGFVQQSISDGVAPTLLYFLPLLIVSTLLLSSSLDDYHYFDWFRQTLTSLTSVIPAPMETRNMFLIIALAVLFGVFFSIFATTVAASSIKASSPASRSYWDRFGVGIGERSRVVAACACDKYGAPYLFPPPFNLLSAILVRPVEFGAKRLGRSLEFAEKLHIWLWRLTVLPFLFVAFVILKVIG